MKHPLLFLLCLTAAWLTVGCGESGPSSSAQNNPPSEERSSSIETNNAPVAEAAFAKVKEPEPKKPEVTGVKTNSTGSWEKLVMHPVHDAQGTLTMEVPLPAQWKLTSRPKPGEPTIEGPNGVKVVDYPLQMFRFTSDPRMQQMYTQAGQRLRPLPNLEALVQQDLAPWAEKRGLKFVKQYEIPEVTRVDKWFNDQLFKAVPGPMQIAAIGTEWESADGEPCFILMHLNEGTSQQLQIWSYYCSVLQADKAHFETARKLFIFGLSNARYNLEPIAAYNRMEAQKAGQSWAAHNARMAQNQAAFEASQRNFVNRSTAAHDALMQNWNARNVASDRTQERFVDTITERTKVVDPASGQQHKVESGYNHYWINSDGKYLSTDKQDYNPNLDEALNNKKWEELKKVNN